MNTNQGQQANATAERPQGTDGKLIDNRRNEDALLKLLMVHLLSVGGYALTAISAWLILGLVAGTVVMVALGTRGKEGAQMGVLIAAGLVIAACCCTYSLMTDRFLRAGESAWLRTVLSTPIVTLAGCSLDLAVSLGTLIIGCLIAWGGFALAGLGHMGALYICALLSSLLAFVFTITLLFMRKDGVSQLRMADRFDDSGQREAKLAWLNAAISQNSRTGRAYFERAQANQFNLWRTSGQVRDTLLNGILDDIEKAVTLDPGISDTYRLRSELLKDQGLLEGALEDIDRAVAIEPLNVRFHNLRTSILRARQEWPLAIESRTRCIELQPEEYSQYSSRGELLMEVGEFGAAYRDFSKALALLAGNYNSSFVYIQRGNASAAMGDLVEAEADHRQATRDDPSNKDRCQKERVYWYDKGCAIRCNKDVASDG